MSRRERGTSPMPFEKYDRLADILNDGENVMMIPQAQPPGFHPFRPFIRNLGLVGLGAGLGIAGYHFRHPLKKLGQKALNYGLDKFHYLFTPNNETNSSTSAQIANRAGF